jgi:hypothetical protein
MQQIDAFDNDHSYSQFDSIDRTTNQIIVVIAQGTLALNVPKLSGKTALFSNVATP